MFPSTNNLPGFVKIGAERSFKSSSDQSLLAQPLLPTRPATSSWETLPVFGSTLSFLITCAPISLKYKDPFEKCNPPIEYILSLPCVAIVTTFLEEATYMCIFASLVEK